MEALEVLIFGGASLYALIWLYILCPSRMAKERNRDPTNWVLIAIVGSPFLAILLLYALGEEKG